MLKLCAVSERLAKRSVGVGGSIRLFLSVVVTLSIY